MIKQQVAQPLDTYDLIGIGENDSAANHEITILNGDGSTTDKTIPNAMG